MRDYRKPQKLDLSGWQSAGRMEFEIVKLMNPHLAERAKAMTNSQAPQPVPEKLWLWKNHVDGRPEYWAFDNPFPVHLDCDDPQTLGEPCGYALFKPSRAGRTDIPEAEVIRRIKAAKPEGNEVLEMLKKLDKAAMAVVWAQNQHEARVAVHWLAEATKQAHVVIAKATGAQA